MRIAVIGGGVSGIASAQVLQRLGHEVVIYERAPVLGGVWALAYPEVRLQNVAEHYRLSDVPWDFPVDLHPTREQILRYWRGVVDRSSLDLRLGHEVTRAHEGATGWRLEIAGPDGASTAEHDFLLVAAGHYSGAPQRLHLPGEAQFAGEVVTDREVDDLERLRGKRVIVVGFGKSAADMAAFAAARGSRVNHVFRAPRWLIPQEILGVHGAKILFSRMSTAMITSWVHPGRAERLLHERLAPVVRGFWSMIAGLIRLQVGLHPLHRDPAARARMRRLLPEDPVPRQMRSAVALAPRGYYPAVIEGTIEPVRGEPVAFEAEGLRLADGRTIAGDLVILSTGFSSPRFPYLPDRHRALLERDEDGVQLYRHLVHPELPRLAFAGFNHGFLHVPGVEIAALWLGALLRGDLALPSVEAMTRSVAAVQAWKRENVLFEPSRGCGVATRFHQYFDVLLSDLGLDPRRKGSRLAELVGPYTAADYAGLVEEYERLYPRDRPRDRPRQPLPLDT